MAALPAYMTHLAAAAARVVPMGLGLLVDPLTVRRVMPVQEAAAAQAGVLLEAARAVILAARGGTTTPIARTAALRADRAASPGMEPATLTVHPAAAAAVIFPPQRAVTEAMVVLVRSGTPAMVPVLAAAAAAGQLCWTRAGTVGTAAYMAAAAEAAAFAPLVDMVLPVRVLKASW
jgi:hypothetical protein